MSNGAAENEWLSHIFHFNCRLDARFNAHFREGAAKGESIDHRGEHTHVIRGCPVHPAMRCGESAPNIPAADDDRNLNPELVHFLDSLGDLAHHVRRDVIACAFFLESFAAQLQHDAFVSGRLGFHSQANETEENNAWKAKW